MAKENLCLFLGGMGDLERADTNNAEIPNLFLALIFQQDSQASVIRGGENSRNFMRRIPAAARVQQGFLEGPSSTIPCVVRTDVL